MEGLSRMYFCFYFIFRVTGNTNLTLNSLVIGVFVYDLSKVTLGCCFKTTPSLAQLANGFSNF